MSANASQITGVSIVAQPSVHAQIKDKIGLCEGNQSVTGGFSSQNASNAEMFPFDDIIMTEGNYIYIYIYMLHPIPFVH